MTKNKSAFKETKPNLMIKPDFDKLGEIKRIKSSFFEVTDFSEIIECVSKGGDISLDTLLSTKRKKLFEEHTQIEEHDIPLSIIYGLLSSGILEQIDPNVIKIITASLVDSFIAGRASALLSTEETKVLRSEQTIKNYILSDLVDNNNEYKKRIEKRINVNRGRFSEAKIMAMEQAQSLINITPEIPQGELVSNISNTLWGLIGTDKVSRTYQTPAAEETVRRWVLEAIPNHKWKKGRRRKEHY